MNRPRRRHRGKSLYVVNNVSATFNTEVELKKAFHIKKPVF